STLRNRGHTHSVRHVFRHSKLEVLMKRSVGALAIAALALAIGSPASAAPEHVKSGILSCDISAGLGLIIGSNKQVTCMYNPSAGGPREVYVGSISKFGLDIGATAGGRMEWAVYAPTNRRFGALAGHYTGASAEATVGLGAGVNVLV